MIGDDITITLVEINDRQIRIGINAPKSIGVHREEVYNRIKAEGGPLTIGSPNEDKQPLDNSNRPAYR